MALDTWLIKVKTVISNHLDTVRTTTNTKMAKKSCIGVLAFEIAGLMSKLLHLWKSLSDQNIVLLRNESIALEGIHKIISNDDAFLLSLACAEIVENLRLVANSVSRLGKGCHDLALQSFDQIFDEFADSGHDSHNWVLSWKEMESKSKKIDQYVTITTMLYREMNELSEIESGLKKLLQYRENEVSIKDKKIIDLKQKLIWQKQEVKYMKERSLWSKSFDTVTLLLAKSVFTVLARIKLVFGIKHSNSQVINTSLQRSLSATVYPSENSTTTTKFILGFSQPSDEKEDLEKRFMEMNLKILKPPSSTLGAVGLSLHYANLIIVIEKMIKSPHLIGFDAREDVYAMLPTSIRSSLKARLKGVGYSTSEPDLAGEWKDALGRILGWLSPLAYNMIKWQSERSFEQQNLIPRTNVLLLQTLYFANQMKTEAAITELLVGLNYIWRFEREMTAKAFECSNLNGVLNLQNSG